MKRLFLVGITAFTALLMSVSGFPADPPHNFDCGKCHVAHNALGASLTSSASNVNLCLSCHVSGQPGANKALYDYMQGASSHAWGTPLVNTTKGAELPKDSATILRIENRKIGMATQNSTDALSVTYSSGNYVVNGLIGQTLQFYLTSAGTSANKELQRSIANNTSTTIRWDNAMPANPVRNDRYLVIPSDAKLTCSICHAQHSQKSYPFDPNSSYTYTAGVTNNRHMLRRNNDLNQLCYDCHRSRAMNYNKAKGADGSYPANGTNVFSHPVGELMNSQGYDYARPLDANGIAQTNSPSANLANRYAGDVDGNPTNNQVLDINGFVVCMTCHRVHYTDSNPQTVDAP